MATLFPPPHLFGHGTVIFPESRVYKVYQSGPEAPDFELAEEAVDIDGTLSYYTWNEVSRNIADAVDDGLPEGFDYSEWMPDGELASAGRTDPLSPDYPRTYAGLDQVSADWPTTTVIAGETIEVDWLATAPHDPSVWDVWMTTPDWTPDTELNWDQMEFLLRPEVTFEDDHYTFDLDIPIDRAGHHVLWVAWQRDDPVGEVFISASDIWIENEVFRRGDVDGDSTVSGLVDTIALLAYAFVGGVEPPCLDAADVDDDGEVTALVDSLALLQWAFASEEAPPEPGPEVCGPDPTDDLIECETALADCE